MAEGQPKFVSALGATNEAEGWRANKAGGGVLIDVATGAIAAADVKKFRKSFG